MIIQKEMSEWIGRPIFWPTSECQVSLSFRKKPLSGRMVSLLPLSHIFCILFDIGLFSRVWSQKQ